MRTIIQFFVDSVGDVLAATLAATKAEELTDQVRERLLAWAATDDHP